MAEEPRKQRFVVDTSAFLTEEIRRDDEDLEAALERYVTLIADAKLERGARHADLPPGQHTTSRSRARRVVSKRQRRS